MHPGSLGSWYTQLGQSCVQYKLRPLNPHPRINCEGTGRIAQCTKTGWGFVQRPINNFFKVSASSHVTSLDIFIHSEELCKLTLATWVLLQSWNWKNVFLYWSKIHHPPFIRSCIYSNFTEVTHLSQSCCNAIVLTWAMVHRFIFKSFPTLHSATSMSMILFNLQTSF